MLISMLLGCDGTEIEMFVHTRQPVEWRQAEFGIQSGDGRWDKCAPNFGKRDWKDEPLQMPMVRMTAG